MAVVGDRIVGLVAVVGAVGFGSTAASLPLPFFAAPLGPRAFPLTIAAIIGICGLVMLLKPDPDPEWPSAGGWASLAIATVVLIAYAYTLKPLGFLIPTAIAAGILSWQIQPRIGFAIMAGIGLSIGLFVVFRFVLGLGLIPFPEDAGALFDPSEATAPVQIETPATEAEDADTPTPPAAD